MLYLILAAAMVTLVIAWKAQAESVSGAQHENKSIKQDLSQSVDTGQLGDPAIDSGYVRGAGMPASHGWFWLSDALRIVKNSSRIYVALFLVAILNWQGILRIPHVGYMVSLLLNPLIMGMMMLLSRMVVAQNRMDVWNMKLRPHIATLLAAGVAYCFAIAAVTFIVQLITGRPIWGHLHVPYVHSVLATTILLDSIIMPMMRGLRRSDTMYPTTWVHLKIPCDSE